MPRGLDVCDCSLWSCAPSDATHDEVRTMTLYGHQGLSHLLHREQGCMLVVKWPCEVADCALAPIARSLGGKNGMKYRHRNG